MARGKFPREKILTVSAKDYAESMGRTVSSYDMVGIGGDHCHAFDALEKLCVNFDLPENTEAIVDLRPFGGDRHGTIYATALIPKSLNPLNLDINLSEFHFSVRVRNGLRKAGVRYLGELAQKTEAELFQAYKNRVSCLSEIQKALESVGLKLGMDIKYTPPDQRE